MKPNPRHTFSGSMSRAAVRLVLSGLITVALLPPLLWLAAGVWIEHHRVAAQLESIRWVVGGHLAPSAGVDAAGAVRLLEHLPVDDPRQLRRLSNARGEHLASFGSEAALAWPSWGATQPLHLVGAGQAEPDPATLEVRHSLRPLLASAALVGLASAALSLALWALALRRPVQVIELAEHRLRTFAKRDALTGLLNRDGLRSSLARSLARCRGRSVKVGLLVIDIDRFRLVNDSLGQPAGDELLRSVADRIRAVVRDSDVVARLGADQFVVQIESHVAVEALKVMARNLLRAFEPACTVGGDDTLVTLSIGIAVAGAQVDGVDPLLQCAELALRAAKTGGGGRSRCYEPAMKSDDNLRLDMDQRLRSALPNGEFALVFQPIMAAADQRIVGVETLLRWHDPSRGVVSPADFIPLLEQTGLILGVGSWVLREACRQCLGWNAGAEAALVLSVNVSPLQFAEADFADSVLATLAETGFPATLLQLEVTEGLLLDPRPESLHKMERLVASGVRLAVDDFGMGYSSLAYLKRFPLHTLKIDQMFVRDIAQHNRDAAIVRAIIDLGHGLGLQVTAEGVETVQQMRALRDLGCDSLQGFLLSRPVNAQQMQVMLARPARIDLDGAAGATSGLTQALDEALEPA